MIAERVNVSTDLAERVNVSTDLPKVIGSSKPAERTHQQSNHCHPNTQRHLKRRRTEQSIIYSWHRPKIHEKLLYIILNKNIYSVFKKEDCFLKLVLFTVQYSKYK
jgi:hypothetical protein